MIRLRGLEEVQTKLNNKIKAVGSVTMKSLIEGAAIIRRDMDKTPPKIPVRTGNLRSSWTVIPGYKATKPYVIMGFTAEYAAKTHETPMRYRRRGAGMKYFEKSIERNTDRIIELIKQNLGL